MGRHSAGTPPRPLRESDIPPDKDVHPVEWGTWRLGLVCRDSIGTHGFALGVGHALRSSLPAANRSQSSGLHTMPRGFGSRDQLRIFDLPSASVYVMSHDITGFILIRFLCKFMKQTMQVFQNSIFFTNDRMPLLQNRHTGDLTSAEAHSKPPVDASSISPSVVSPSVVISGSNDSGSKGLRPCRALRRRIK